MSFKVLVCDDSSLARKLAARSLPPGFASEVYQACNGEQALDLLDTHAIELLLLDLTMPVMDGVAVLEAIKASLKDIFVIVVSGDVQPQMREKVMKLGALDFIAKPIDSVRLGQILNQYGLY